MGTEQSAVVVSSVVSLVFLRFILMPLLRCFRVGVGCLRHYTIAAFFKKKVLSAAGWLRVG